MVYPLAQIEVEPQTEDRMTARVMGRRNHGRPTHHQARAGHDSLLTRLDDALVHAIAQAEIVGIDDQIASGTGWFYHAISSGALPGAPPPQASRAPRAEPVWNDPTNPTTVPPGASGSNRGRLRRHPVR